MTRQEYLNQKTEEVTPVSGTINNLLEYLIIRKQCEEFEDRDITEFLTEDDYEAFDVNFNKCLESLQSKDVTDEIKLEQSDIEKVHEMMKLTGWKWAGIGENCKSAIPSVEQIIGCIKYCYEESLKSGHARGGCSTGGVNVETDILGHSVRIAFEQFEISQYDEENDGCGE